MDNKQISYSDQLFIEEYQFLVNYERAVLFIVVKIRVINGE